MSIIGDLIEDDSADRIADLTTHLTTLRRENNALRWQRDRYRKQAESRRRAS